MVDILKLAAVSILPGVLWVAYFRSKDVYDPEPTGLLVRTFLTGALMIIPAGIIEAPFRRIILNPPSLGALLLTSIFAVGFVEEYLKYWVVRRLVYSHDEFNEPVDGVVYALTAGLGFAAFENVLYTMSYGLSVGITRGVVTSIVHASFSGIIGFAMGTAKFAPESVREITIWRSIVTASVLHGLYDFLLITEMVSFPLLVGVVLFLYFGILSRIGKALRMSPFAKRGSPWAHHCSSRADDGAPCGPDAVEPEKSQADSAGARSRLPAGNGDVDGET